MALGGARRVARGARDVRARVDAREVDARLVRRAPGVPEAHERGGRTVVRAHAHGPVVERQALFVGRARAAAVAVAVARTAAPARGGAPQVRRAVRVRATLALGGRARQLAQLAEREPVLARAPRPVVADRARLGRLARQPVARVAARAVRRARQRRRTVRVRRARGRGGRGDRRRGGGAHAARRVGHAPYGRVARVAVRARALGPVQRRPAQRVQATRVTHATHVDATSVDARLFVCTLTVVGAFDLWRNAS